MRVQIKGKSSGSGANFLGTPFLQAAVYTGTIDQGAPVTANLLSASDAAWIPGEFATAPGENSASHYVEILSSTNAEAIGLVSDILSHTASTLTTIDNLSPFLAGGERFCIRPHHTLGSLFGESNEDQIEKGTNDSADTISVLRSGENASFSTYYFRDAQLGGAGWRSSSNPFTSEEDRAIRPHDGLYILRTADSDSTVIMHGEVRLNPMRVIVRPGLNMLGLSMPITDGSLAGAPKVTLGGEASEAVVPSGLEDVLAPGNTSTADTISIFDGSSFESYYLKDGSSPLGGTGWRKLSNPFDDASDVVLPEAGAVLLRNNGQPKIWTIPAPF
jgi:uncharacterized protein (TIGR02597 family)